MHGRQVQRGLPRALGRSPHSGQQQGPTGDGLYARLGLGAAAVPTPPVVNQRTGTRRVSNHLLTWLFDRCETHVVLHVGTFEISVLGLER